ncbi:hypothetical protein [Kitasatospora cineracea]|uniref:hypothetical protein n=1 Tax=Kitasatospora cineracea TaxID=88074 RepID=UPI003679C5DA
MAGLLYRQTALGALLLVMCVLSTALYATLTKRSIGDTVLEDLTPVTPLAVRQGWATIAVVIDWMLVVGVPSVILGIATGPSIRASLPMTSAGKLVAVVIVGVGFTVFHSLAHWLATRPARHRRVFVARPARTTN